MSNIKPKKHLLTGEQKHIAIEMASEGKSLTEIMKAICITSYNFWVARDRDSQFSKDFEQARQNGLENMADKLIDIADDMTIDVHRARLKSDNAKWLLSKRKPQVYGDKLDLNVNQVVDISSALGEAMSRARLRDVSDTAKEIEGAEITDANKIPGGDNS